MTENQRSNPKGIIVAGLSGGSGKSVVSVGLTALLSKENKRVVPFKKGPDYIDAGWLKLAAGEDCYNLDPYLMDKDIILQSYYSHGSGADYIVVEGNRGIYDGVNAVGGYSTAELAKMLDLPVILVVNCTKTTRTVAAMVLGCQTLDPTLRICGVILNQVATKRQINIITEAVELYTGLPVLGAVKRMKRDIFPMRHLGMIPHQEYSDSDGALSFLVSIMEESVDLAKIKDLMSEIQPPENAGLKCQQSELRVGVKAVRIGVLQDAAFQFYYSENLEALERQGAELIRINAIEEQELPELDGLYIGGGFPETSARLLSLNERFRKSVKRESESGLPIYAECGGLIYLGDSIDLEGETFKLCSVFPVKFGMSIKPQAHGYSILDIERENPFYKTGETIKGHEFRYSTILSCDQSEFELCGTMQRGTGFTDGREGLLRHNTFALYTHIHADGTPQWAKQFVSFCRGRKK